MRLMPRPIDCGTPPVSESSTPFMFPSSNTSTLPQPPSSQAQCWGYPPLLPLLHGTHPGIIFSHLIPLPLPLPLCPALLSPVITLTTLPSFPPSLPNHNSKTLRYHQLTSCHLQTLR